MTSETPVRTAAFERALGDLDAGAFAAFVGELRSHSGHEVAVEPPVVTVGTGDDRVRLRVVPAGAEPPDPGDAVDALVTAEAGGDESTIGPADLRQRLLYGLDPPAADRLSRRFLGMPARSPRYAPPEGSDGDEQSATGACDEQSASETGDGEQRAVGSGPGPTAEHATGGTRAADPGPDSRPSTDPTRQSTPAVGSTAVTDRPWLVVAAVATLALAAGGGAVLVADAGPGVPGAGVGEGVGPGDDTRSEMNPPTDGGRPAPVPTEAPTPTARSTATPPVAGGSDGGVGATPASERYANPEPTCDRSYLHVVQIQVNALQYNGDANDGIRTVRRFASPRNREAVGSFDQFVAVVESPTYAPLLAAESATFRPERTGEDRARVRVTTRVTGNVTGRYEFRLGKQDGGRYEGCWMTDGVRPLDTGAYPGSGGGEA